VGPPSICRGLRASERVVYATDFNQPLTRIKRCIPHATAVLMLCLAVRQQDDSA
jgi:hypothetical protein